MCIYICVYMYICTYTCVYIYMSVYVYMYICLYIYVCIYIYMWNISLKPHQKFLGGGFLTTVPPWWSICTMNSNKTGILDLYQNTPQILAARFFLFTGIDSRWVQGRGRGRRSNLVKNMLTHFPWGELQQTWIAPFEKFRLSGEVEARTGWSNVDREPP